MQNNLFNNKNIVFDPLTLSNVYTTFNNECCPRTSGTFSPGNNGAYFWYMGVACKGSTSASVMLQITTTASGFTANSSNYYEIFIFKGDMPPPRSMNPLTRCGYLSVTSQFSSTGIKLLTIPLTTPLNTGDNFWFGAGLSCTPVAAWRTGATPVFSLYNSNITALGRRIGATGTAEQFPTAIITSALPWMVIKI